MTQIENSPESKEELNSFNSIPMFYPTGLSVTEEYPSISGGSGNFDSDDERRAIEGWKMGYSKFHPDWTEKQIEEAVSNRKKKWDALSLNQQLKKHSQMIRKSNELTQRYKAGEITKEELRSKLIEVFEDI